MREYIQLQAINDISKVYFSDNNIYMAELGTGSGKTKILLDSAFEILKKTNKSVIISTYSNQLVSQMKAEAEKYNSLNISNYSLDDIAILIGKSNYINPLVVLSDDFLEEKQLNKDEVEDFINTTDGLTSEFINKFHLETDLANLISYNEETNEDAPKLSSYINSIVNDEPKIYVTNHMYLLVLYSFGRKINEDIYKIPLLLDEVHTLNNAGSLFFSNTFSAFRLMTICSSILQHTDSYSVEIKKNFIALKSSIASIFSLKKDSTEMDKTSYIESLKKLNTLISKNEKINNFLNKNKTSTKGSIDQYKSMFKKELIEMKSILYTIEKRPKLELNIYYSPVKSYPTCSVMTDNPVKMLRDRLFSRSRGYICGLSGTLKVSQEERLFDNKWSFERIGLYEYSENLIKEVEDNENLLLWNSRVKSIIFKIYEPIFKKNQALYKIFEDIKYQYPKYDKARAMETRKNLEFNWINNIADGIEENIQGNTLILMTSYDNVYTMKEKLDNIATNKEAYIHDYEIIAASENESLEITKNKYIKAKESGNKVILIAGLNAYTGLDLPGDLIDTLVFAKLPFEPNIKFFSSYNYGSYSTHSNNKLKAILTFRQGLGRGLRSVSDKVCYLIFDNRILEKRNSQFLYFLDKMALNADELAQ